MKTVESELLEKSSVAAEYFQRFIQHREDLGLGDFNSYCALGWNSINGGYELVRKDHLMRVFVFLEEVSVAYSGAQPLQGIRTIEQSGVNLQSRMYGPDMIGCMDLT